MEPVVEVEALRKTYPDGTEAVADVTFDVAPGEIFGLLGPNGAGKTTTMRILGTLHRQTGGDARVLGLDVAKQGSEVRRRIGFAMQEVGMDDLATAREMLMLHARLYGISKTDARRRADELLATFDLAEHADRRVTRFSGGMQRRLDLAVSLIHDPEVLFLDEPSTGLDPKSRSDLWDILHRLRRDHGLTIFMSTHYMEEAEVLCDRIGIMNQGRLSAIDTPEALKRSVGADTVRIRVQAPPTTQQQAALRSTFGSHVSVDGDVVEVKVRDGGEALLPALDEVTAAGLKVASTRVLTPTLDDVFLQYTGSRLGEAAADEEVDA
ncbi:MAG: ATP-binding cassette domain-containing protein [Thermoplasmatota archaeon]